MGPNYACLFVGYIEERIRSTYIGFVPQLHEHYIDDVVKAAQCSRIELEDFINYVSNWRASCKKGVYRILSDFHFLQDWANFWQTDLFWHEKHCSVIVSVDLRFVLQK